MTEEEFERLKRRFGADVSTWPAPHRQEGLAFIAGEDGASEDDALDRLVLDAATVETDEVTLARKVLAEINDQRQPVNWFLEFRRVSAMPVAAASGFAALLIVAAVAGYAVADRSLDVADDFLMALALGGGSLDSGDAGSGLLDELGGEEQL
jgi:hypothetical protein